jgi:hypothetical protein
MFGKKQTTETKSRKENYINYNGKFVIGLDTGSSGMARIIDEFYADGYELLGLDNGWGYAIMKKPITLEIKSEQK